MPRHFLIVLPFAGHCRTRDVGRTVYRVENLLRFTVVIGFNTPFDYFALEAVHFRL